MTRTTLTFHGGVSEIGGNKILLEDGDARLWLDMGASFHLGETYFADFLNPRERFGLRDYLALNLVPWIPELFSAEALSETDSMWEPPRFSGIAITHVHWDHTNHLRFVDPGIPVHLGEGTKAILDSWQTTARSPIVNLKDHAYQTFRSGRSFDADGLEVEPVHVDHSAPAAYGYIAHTDAGAIVYTGDLRQHGPRADMTQEFIETARKAKPAVLITEGTRVAPEDPRANLSEADVKTEATRLVREAEGRLAIATFYPRDVDRIRTFYEVALAADRRFVVNAKTAHLLQTLLRDPRLSVPDVTRDANVLIHFRELDKMAPWERDLEAMAGDRVVSSEYIRDHQGELVLQLEFVHLAELIDIRPNPGSPFIHSRSEPFDEEDVDDQVLQNWLDRFGLVRHQLHASGHMSMREIEEMVRTIRPRTVIPVHTEHPEMFVRFAENVVLPKRNEPLTVT